MIIAFGQSQTAGPEERDNFLRYLLERAKRAPEYIQAKLYDKALNDPNDSVRVTYINALLDAKILNFIQAFIDKLDRESNDQNIESGLDKSKELVTAEGRLFSG
jgi:hypothetical protein